MANQCHSNSPVKMFCSRRLLKKEWREEQRAGFPSLQGVEDFKSVDSVKKVTKINCKLPVACTC